MFGSHATDIVGYTFNADQYCPGCVFNLNGLSEVNAETRLDLAAQAAGIDRHDERSYDSSDFPKVIFPSDVESSDERCGGCGESLISD